MKLQYFVIIIYFVKIQKTFFYLVI